MKTKNIAKNGVLIACFLFLLLILAGIVAIIALLYLTPRLSFGKVTTTDPWQVCYYIFTIIGSIGTLAAVIIALYKEELMRWINSPELNFSLVDSGLSANYESQVGTSPDSYDCSVRVTNHGTTIATGCKTFIKSLKYNRNGNRERLKILNIVQNKKQLTWTSGSVDLPVDIPSDILLFQIMNPNQIGTPQVGNVIQNPKIVLNGYQLGKDKAERGLWEIEYYVTMRSGNVSRFLAIIEWDGTWSDNVEDMLDKVKLELKQL